MLCQVSAQKGRAERKKEERLARREILDCRKNEACDEVEEATWVLLTSQDLIECYFGSTV
jgi:hypothetical protein